MLHEQFNGYVVLSRYSSVYAAAIKKHLAAGTFSHKFSSLLKKYGHANTPAQTVVRVVFYPSKLIIIAIKEDVLQIIQSITYSTAEDALYNIMHICAEYGIATDSTAIIASGLINTGSSLYDTLYRYLENFELEKGTENTFAATGFAEHPPHYFLHFIQ